MTDLPPAERLALIVERILSLLFGRNVNGIYQRVTLNGAALYLIDTTLRRVVRRFAATLLRLAAGTLVRPRRPTAPLSPRPPREAPPRREWPYRLRSTPGWLHRIIEPKHNLNSLISHLHDLVRDPVIQNLVSQAPQFRRILSPLCTMMGVEPPPLPVRTRPPKRRSAAPDPTPGRSSGARPPPPSSACPPSSNKGRPNPPERRRPTHAHFVTIQ